MTERMYTLEDLARAWDEGEMNGREAASLAAHYGIVKITWNPYKEKDSCETASSD